MFRGLQEYLLISRLPLLRERWSHVAEWSHAAVGAQQYIMGLLKYMRSYMNCWRVVPTPRGPRLCHKEEENTQRAVHGCHKFHTHAPHRTEPSIDATYSTNVYLRARHYITYAGRTVQFSLTSTNHEGQAAIRTPSSNPRNTPDR